MNFEQARFNMVEQQVRPWEVLDERVLELLEKTHREDFVPLRYRKMAFADMAIPLGDGHGRPGRWFSRAGTRAGAGGGAARDVDDRGPRLGHRPRRRHRVRQEGQQVQGVRAPRCGRRATPVLAVVIRQPVNLGVERREQCGDRRFGPGGRCETSIERDRLPRQAVDRRRDRAGESVDTEVIGPQRIDHQDDDVRAVGRRNDAG